jgi:tyrosyl-tRNA synthetase
VSSDVFAELKWRGFVNQVTDDELGTNLASGPVTLYHGIDATADSLHVGNFLGIRALQLFQRAGHRPIACLGGATTLIGDPSGKADERPMRDRDEIESNVAAIRSQLERFLHFGGGESGAVLVNNAEWLGPYPLLDFLRDVGKHFSVNVMTAKESVRARLDSGLSFTEFSYMLMQAYDFLHLFDSLGCRLQVGGSDQWGNITAGVDLVRRTRGAEVWGLTWPLLTKADGTKFGKSEAGNVWLDPAKTSPYEFFQFWINTDDRDVGRYLRLFTDLGREEIAALDASTAERPQDREAQRALAMAVTSQVHGLQGAIEVTGVVAALFAGHLRGLSAEELEDVFRDAPSTTLVRSELDSAPALVDVLVRTGLAASKSAARTTIAQGGIYLNDARVEGTDRRLTADDLLGDTIILRKGKRSYHLLRFT